MAGGQEKKQPTQNNSGKEAVSCFRANAILQKHPGGFCINWKQKLSGTTSVFNHEIISNLGLECDLGLQKSLFSDLNAFQDKQEHSAQPLSRLEHQMRP